MVSVARVSSRVRNRLVQKQGDINVSQVNVPKQRRKFFRDIFTTIVDIRWRWCLLLFISGFVLSWLLFATLYYLAISIRGGTGQGSNRSYTPCIRHADGFSGVFFFSVFTQHTIGYGYRYPTEDCPEVFILICIQSIIGVMIQTLMAGVFFAKISRPKKRAGTIVFSKNAVISMRDGALCFLFRLGDMRRSQLAEAHVRLQMIKNRITLEGELLPFYQYDMDVGFDSGKDRVFVVWPITVCHVIDKESPLYDVNRDDLVSARFEIVAILEGVVESSGATTQARTSYLPAEIKWGHRFEKLVSYQRDNGEYRIDFGKFHHTYSCEMPSCSAKDLAQMNELGCSPKELFENRTIENEGQTPYSTLHGSIEAPRPSIVPIPTKEFRIEVVEERRRREASLSPRLRTMIGNR